VQAANTARSRKGEGRNVQNKRPGFFTRCSKNKSKGSVSALVNMSGVSVSIREFRRKSGNAVSNRYR
jgi:hypothetical protein